MAGSHSFPLPASGGVHLALVRLDAPETADLLAAAEELFDAADHGRLAARTTHRGRCRFLAGRWMLRHALAAALGREPATFAIGTSPEGRPEAAAAAAAGLSFSLSHAGDWVVLALGPAACLGVDVEPLGREATAQRIAESGLFDPRETIEIMAQGKGAALRSWTAKEAVAKALGLDIWSAARGVVLRSTPPALCLMQLPAGAGPPDHWQVWTMVADGTHQVAIAGTADTLLRPAGIHDVLTGRTLSLADLAGSRGSMPAVAQPAS